MSCLESISAQEITMSPPGKVPKQVHQCRPGPWGQVEYFYTYLEAPSHLMEEVGTPSERTTWIFPQKTLDEIRVFLQSAGLGGDALERTMGNSAPFALNTPFRIYPPNDVVEGLTPQIRSNIYRELRRSRLNRHHFSPAVIESGNVRDWLFRTQLREEIVSKIEQLSYPLGNALAFSDIPLILTSTNGDAEDRAVLKALTRTRSLIARLRITPDSDFEALKSYWAAGYKNKDILPLLESVARTPGVEMLDLAHLLPSTPRKYLYTYPSEAFGLEGVYPDSFWTAMNFFEYLPRAEFNDPDFLRQYAQANYNPAQQPYQFGDLLILFDPKTRRERHACVFIADDIVYTKNGRSSLRPFILMKLPDLLSLHSLDGPPSIEAWRKKAR